MISTITFDQGVSAQWTWVGSAPGQGFNRKTIYGSEGSLDWGSGLHQRNTGDLISTDEIYQKFMSSLSESEREYFFPRDIDNTIAIELKYFADAINSGSQPEVDGLEGYRSQAICMAVYESGYFGRSVTIEEIEKSKASAMLGVLNKYQTKQSKTPEHIMGYNKNWRNA